MNTRRDQWVTAAVVTIAFAVAIGGGWLAARRRDLGPKGRNGRRPPSVAFSSGIFAFILAGMSDGKNSATGQRKVSNIKMN